MSELLDDDLMTREEVKSMFQALPKAKGRGSSSSSPAIDAKGFVEFARKVIDIGVYFGYCSSEICFSHCYSGTGIPRGFSLSGGDRCLMIMIPLVNLPAYAFWRHCKEQLGWCVCSVRYCSFNRVSTCHFS